MAKGDVGIFLNYKTKENEEILVRSGVSLVDMAGARNNLKQELADPFGWDFEKVVDNARSVWDEYLGRIAIETDDYLQKKNSIRIFIVPWQPKQPGAMWMVVL